MEHTPVKFVRFTNGDDVISQLVELQQKNKVDQYTLINPLRVVYMQSGNAGYLQIGFTPFVFNRICGEQEFTISVKDVLLTSNVSDKMIDYYYDSLDMLYEQENESEVKPKKTAPITEDEREEIESYIEALKGIAGGKTYH